MIVMGLAEDQQFMSWIYLVNPHEFKDFQLIKPERITTVPNKGTNFL